MGDIYETKIELRVKDVLELPSPKYLRLPIVILKVLKKQGVNLSEIDIDTLTKKIIQDWNMEEKNARNIADFLLKIERLFQTT